VLGREGESDIGVVEYSSIEVQSTEYFRCTKQSNNPKSGKSVLYLSIFSYISPSFFKNHVNLV
jgi:hypothetical protein